MVTDSYLTRGGVRVSRASEDLPVAAAIDPVLAALDAHLGIKTLMVGFANPTGNFHAPNEWMSLRNIRDGMASLVHLWAELGAMGADELRG